MNINLIKENERLRIRIESLEKINELYAERIKEMLLTIRNLQKEIQATLPSKK